MTTVLITGANRGIGLELCQQYFTNGDRVYACCRKPQAASELTALANASDGRVSIHTMDVSSENSVKACAEELSKISIDVLINNAGVYGGEHQTIGDANLDDWLMTLQINTIGPFRVAESFQQHLKSANNPKMLTVSSLVGASTFSMPIYAYSSSKAAVNKVMQILASEWQQHGISVSLILPGWVKTDMGGPDATITPQESVKGIRQVIKKMDMTNTGSFFKWNGEIHPW
jgi:NAD(P)-dependent dehydrogenase (short-subunit alcohol dehydrogenase family)